MDPFALTRSLIDIESITGCEKAAGEFLFATLSKLAAPTAGAVEQMEVSPDRFNVLATWGTPVVTLSTHMDTVPPFFPSSEDDEFIRGRGACDTKGIIAAMISAAENLLAARTRNFGLLFVVGEEKDSLGALCAAKIPAAQNLSSMESRRKTNWRLAQRVLCATSLPREASSLIPRIPNSANPRLKNYSMCSRMFANFRCRETPCLANRP